MKKRILFICFFISACCTLTAQSTFSFKLSPTLPIANFSGNGGNDVIFFGGEDACATVGFNAGLGYNYAIAGDNLKLAVGVDFFYNSIKKSVDEKFVFLHDYMSSRFSYINVPLMVGLNYTYPINFGTWGIYAEAMVGGNLRFITPCIVEEDIFHTTTEINCEPSLLPSGKFEVGTVFNELISIGLAYNYLGTKTVRGDNIFEGVKLNSYTTKKRMSTHLLSLRVGIHFM